MDGKHDPLISVVTVVLNRKAELEETIESVLGQRDERIEYIVVDGGSSDGTVELIERYSCKIDAIVSEPDGGIYDAMNKGVSLSNGNWIIFINAGDRLEKISERMWSELGRLDESAVIHGRCRICMGNGREFVWGRPVNKCDEIILNPPFFHQALFYNRRLINKYRLDYSIIADRVMTCEICQKHGLVKFKYIDEIVAAFLHGGVSSTNPKKIFQEEMRFGRESGLYQHYFMWFLYKRIKVAATVVLKRFPGASLLLYFRWRVVSWLLGRVK